MYAKQDVLQAAREIRPYLSELLDIPIARAVDQQLEQLLEQADGMDHSAAILDLLTAVDPTREWMRLYLEERQPPEAIVKTLRSYHPLPGKTGAIASPRYRCPVANCNRFWYRRDVEATVPNCPIHGLQMVRDSKAAVE